MGWFRTSKKTGGAKRGRKPGLTLEQAEKKLDIKEKQFLSTELIKMAQEDTELKRQLIAKARGLDLKPPSAAEATKAKIQETISKAALEAINEDPELKAEFVKDEIGNIIGRSRRRTTDGDSRGYDFEPTNPLMEALESVDAMEQLKEKLGGGGGKGLSGLIDAEVITAFINNLPLILGRGGPSLPPSFQVRDVERPRIQGAPTPPPQTPIPEPPLPPTVEEMPPIDQSEPEEPFVVTEIPQEEDGIDLLSWLPYLEQEPNVFVTELVEGAATENKISMFTMNFLRLRTVDEVLESFQPFKENEHLGEVITKLEADKSWLAEVIVGLKMIMGEVA